MPCKYVFLHFLDDDASPKLPLSSRLENVLHSVSARFVFLRALLPRRRLHDRCFWQTQTAREPHYTRWTAKKHRHVAFSARRMRGPHLPSTCCLALEGFNHVARGQATDSQQTFRPRHVRRKRAGRSYSLLLTCVWFALFTCCLGTSAFSAMPK